MLTRFPSATAMKLECLEARDVPAVMLDYTFNSATATYEPAGGSVLVSEIALTGSERFIATDGNITTGTAKSPTANDILTVRLSDSKMTLFSADGIFAIHRESASFVPLIISYGTSVTIENVTGLNINLQLGGDDTVVIEGSAAFAPVVDGGPGNDTITDNSTTTSIIKGGAGNDTLTAAGGALDPQLVQFLARTGVNPSLLTLLGTIGPAKSLVGDDGNDTLTATGLGSNFLLDGGLGDDTLFGPTLGFANYLKGGDGNDMIIGGLGLEVMDGGTGSDLLVGFGGGDFYLIQDQGVDLALNKKGDVMFSDPFDAREI